MASVASTTVSFLQDAGVRYVFGIPSGPWMHYMEAMRTREGIDFVLVSNEASAGFMADVCARITGAPGACYGTYGPGATNLSTGVGCAYLDRSPVLAFTTEPSDAMLGRTLQMAIDHQALYAPITKWTTRLGSADPRHTLSQAARVAMSEVPGPVHIGLPADIGPREAGGSSAGAPAPAGPVVPEAEALDEAARLLAAARRPVLAAGLTAARAGAGDALLRLAELHRAPIVTTPMAKGLVPESHPSYAGVLFHSLSDHVGRTHQQADLVVGVGYDPVEFNYEDWMPDAPLVHLDSVPADVDMAPVQPVCNVVGDLLLSLDHLLSVPATRKDWDLDVLAARRKAMLGRLRRTGDGFGPRAALTILRDVLPEDGVMTCDVGAHTHLIGQHWRTPWRGAQIMTNGWSSMGFGVPSAIAAKLCLPERPVACVTGDGGFLMMAGEMATAARLGAPIVFLVLSDRSLTLIGLKQDQRDLPRYGTALGREACQPPDSCFGVPVLSCNDAESCRHALERAFASSGPVVVEALIDGGEYADLILRRHRG